MMMWRQRGWWRGLDMVPDKDGLDERTTQPSWGLAVWSTVRPGIRERGSDWWHRLYCHSGPGSSPQEPRGRHSLSTIASRLKALFPSKIKSCTGYAKSVSSWVMKVQKSTHMPKAISKGKYNSPQSIRKWLTYYDCHPLWNLLSLMHKNHVCQNLG